MVQMSVVQVLPALNSGGVERGTLEVAKELIKCGHRSIVISAGGRMVPELLRDGSEHLECPIGVKSLLTLRWVLPFRYWMNRQHIDILHARSRLPAWISWLAWRGMHPATRPRFVITMHGLYSFSLYSTIVTRGEKLIVVSETTRSYVKHYHPKLPEERILVIQRGVDPTAFPYGYSPTESWLVDWYTQYPQLKKAPVLTLPGRLSRSKGHKDFIELIYQLRNLGFLVYGLIVGASDLHQKRYVNGLKNQIRSLDLEDIVIFTGHRNDMREIYTVSKLVLSLSTKPESFGRTVLEALSLGTPVAGYDHGGVGEILQRIYPIGLVPFGNLEILKEKVICLLTNKLPTVPSISFYPLQHMLDETISLYERLYRRL
jgi:glycosyltransferase involved in cell wall biosynthesis